MLALTAAAFAQGSYNGQCCPTPTVALCPQPSVSILRDGREIASAATNEKGEASFAALPAANYQISVSKDGFETARKEVAGEVGKLPSPSGVTLAPAAQHESVKVMAEAAPIDSGSSASVNLPAQQVKEFPSRPPPLPTRCPWFPA